MKTATINGKKEKISYRSSTGLKLKASHPSLSTALYGANIYTVDSENDKGRVIVATGRCGSPILSTAKYITEYDYQSLLDLDDPYDCLPFHRAIMKKMSFESI